MGLLFFLIYINDLTENLSSNPKLFPYDSSLFSAVHDLNAFANEINNELKKTELWAHQWKMVFNPNPSKQVQEVVFSGKRNKPRHPDITLKTISYKKLLPKTFGNVS